jgi:transcription elongation factor GreB
MSKAFTRESDDEREEPPQVRSALPDGVRNLITPGGAARLRGELDRLVNIERPELARDDDPDARRRLRGLDARIRQLDEILRSAVVVPPPDAGDDRVRFGATVTVRGRDGEATYRIVGAGETDAARGWVSWHSPIARALLDAPISGRVRFRFPSGEEELEILRVSYE